LGLAAIPVLGVLDLATITYPGAFGSAPMTDPRAWV